MQRLAYRPWLVFALMLTARAPAPAADTPAKLHVGLRRSSYGAPARSNDHAWWAERAKRFAGKFPGAQPTIIEILSTYQNNGGTQFEFKRPKGHAGPLTHMKFASEGVDHEQALAEYDRQGVQAILQVEPGDADMLECLRLMHRQFGKHRCVVGLGVDAEWFHTRQSPKKEGRPITDAEAKAWLETTLALNPSYTLFLKHWAPEHMPPTYRHPRLWFLSDSQQFHSAKECLDDFKEWGRHFAGSTVGYQFGYQADRGWWSKLADPPGDLGRRIQAATAGTGYLFWVDFTANRVAF